MTDTRQAPTELVAPSRDGQPVSDLPPSPGSPIGWFERSWWTAAGFMLLLWSFLLLNSISAYPWVTWLVLVAGAWGLWTVIASWSGGGRLTRKWGFGWITLVVASAAFAAWAVLQVLYAPGYGTDELAFDQYAAQLLVHGLNPYVHSMAPAFNLFHVQPDGYTFRLDGSAVTQLSYPALSFLVYTPFLAAGLSSQVAVGLNVVAWIVTTGILFTLLPKSMRPMAIFIAGLSVYVGFAVGGVTVVLFLPLMAAAAYKWDSFVRTSGPAAWRGPALLGLAMCINQVPWFVFPFALLGIYLEGRGLGPRSGLRSAARYLLVVAVAFLVPNIPFIAWDPVAWLHGILVPLTSSAVPAGQGLVTLSLYLGIGGGSLLMYTGLAIVTFVALLVVYALTWPRLRPVGWVLPAVCLLLTTRSYGSYVLAVVPAALVAAVTISAPVNPVQPLRGATASLRHSVLAGAAAVCVLVGVFAVVAPHPLSIRVTGVRTTGQLATVDRVTVLVTNRSDQAVRPHFTLNSGDAVTAFWTARREAVPLPPHSSRSYVLLSPNSFAQPSITGGFQVVAFTTGPASVSTSRSNRPTTDHVSLVPDAVNRIVPIGHRITVKAEVLNQFNQPVRTAGVPVYLGQVIYAQSGLRYAQARINAGQQGETPVSALTNAQGVATFHIVGTGVTSQPDYFEANLVNARHFYPYGYSEILTVRFRPKR